MAAFACRRAEPLPSYGVVPDFTLIDQTGTPFQGSSLNGKIWVADFVFTNCPGPCPRMSSLMHQIQTATASLPAVKLISFTVDPSRDTPSVLLAYANRFHAEAGRWFFLTGEAKDLNRLSKDAFHLSETSADSTKLDHSTRFVLIDRHAQIRGYYGISDPGSTARLIEDIRSLAKDPS